HHFPQTESSLARHLPNLLRSGETPMNNLGVFGESVVEELAREWGRQPARQNAMNGRGGLQRRHGLEEAAVPTAPTGRMGGGAFGPGRAAAPMALKKAAGEDKGPSLDREEAEKNKDAHQVGPGGAPQVVPATVRTNFADTAYWVASLNTDKDGVAEVSFK